MTEQTLTPALQRYGEQLVTLGDQTLTLHVWCANRNISIVSVKRRRDKFCSWADSLAPLDLKRTKLKKIITNQYYGFMRGVKTLNTKKAKVDKHEHVN